MGFLHLTSLILIAFFLPLGCSSNDDSTNGSFTNEVTSDNVRDKPPTNDDATNGLSSNGNLYKGAGGLTVNYDRARQYLTPGVGALPASARPASALPSSGYPPIPPSSSLSIDTTALKAGTFFLNKFDTSECSTSGYDDAMLMLDLSTLIFEISLLFAEVFLEEAKSTTPVKVEDRYMEWRTSGSEQVIEPDGTIEKIDYAVVLLSTKADNILFTNDKLPQGITDSGAFWVMTVTVRGAGYDWRDFVFCNGSSNNNGTMGSWHLFDPNQGITYQKDFLHIDWFKITENDRGTALNTAMADSDGKPFLYRIHHLVEPTRQSLYQYDNSDDYTWVLTVSEEAANGGWMDSNGEGLCWDTNHCDTSDSCPPEINPLYQSYLSGEVQEKRETGPVHPMSYKAPSFARQRVRPKQFH